MMPRTQRPAALIVMGVSGCGKTTVGERLAERLGWPFRDGDGFHPPENVEKMRSGTPLTDADRWPWLDAIAAWIDGQRRRGEHGVIACSALKRAYRDRLRAGHVDVRFVFLDGTRDLIAARLAARKGHYMPASLLDSQLATLERPAPDEDVLTVSVEPPPESIAETVLKELGLARSEA
jgi:carbohydrate kinase (thermoresistant glucokinase family)